MQSHLEAVEHHVQNDLICCASQFSVLMMFLIFFILVYVNWPLMLWSLSFGNFSLLAVKLQLTEAMLNKYALGAFVQLHKLLRFTDEF